MLEYRIPSTASADLDARAEKLEKGPKTLALAVV